MAATARASFSNDSRIVRMPLPKSTLLKDYLLDDLSSCSSNGFRSYPRRQCCTKVRYLIQLDLNKHIKLQPTQKQFLRRSKSKPKSKSKLMKSSPMLYKTSIAVVNVFKNFRFSGSGSGIGNPKKAKFLPMNLSQMLLNHRFWKKTTDHQNKNEFRRLNSFDEPIKRKDNILPPASKLVTSIAAEMKTFTVNGNSSSNDSSNNSASSDSYFTATSNSSTTAGSSKIDNIKEIEPLAMEKMNTGNGENALVTTTTATNATGNPTKKLQGDEKDQFSPICVIDFPYVNDNDNDENEDEDENEVTSPFQHTPFYAKGCKLKLMSKFQRTKSLSRLNPVRLEDRIMLFESRTHGVIHDSSLQIQREFAAEKKAIALLQLLKSTMSAHTLSEFTKTESVLLGYFTERFIKGNVSNNIILQEAKDWVNGQSNIEMMFVPQINKLAYTQEMEKGVKWLKYDKQERRDLVLELEYEVFTSLIEELLLEFYL